MSSSGQRFLRALESYRKSKPLNFDSSVILAKVSWQSLADGCSRSSFKIDESMCNGGDTLHGGFIAASVDTLSTFAHLGFTGKIAWTMNMHVDFINAARIGEEITVETSFMRSGSFPAVEAKFTNKQGVLVAKGITSMLNGADKYQGLVRDVYNFGPEDVE